MSKTMNLPENAMVCIEYTDIITLSVQDPHSEKVILDGNKDLVFYIGDIMLDNSSRIYTSKPKKLIFNEFDHHIECFINDIKN